MLASPRVPEETLASPEAEVRFESVMADRPTPLLCGLFTAPPPVSCARAPRLARLPELVPSLRLLQLSSAEPNDRSSDLASTKSVLLVSPIPSTSQPRKSPPLRPAAQLLLMLLELFPNQGASVGASSSEGSMTVSTRGQRRARHLRAEVRFSFPFYPVLGAWNLCRCCCVPRVFAQRDEKDMSWDYRDVPSYTSSAAACVDAMLPLPLLESRSGRSRLSLDELTMLSVNDGVSIARANPSRTTRSYELRREFRWGRWRNLVPGAAPSSSCAVTV